MCFDFWPHMGVGLRAAQSTRCIALTCAYSKSKSSLHWTNPWGGFWKQTPKISKAFARVRFVCTIKLDKCVMQFIEALLKLWYWLDSCTFRKLRPQSFTAFGKAMLFCFLLWVLFNWWVVFISLILHYCLSSQNFAETFWAFQKAN